MSVKHLPLRFQYQDHYTSYFDLAHTHVYILNTGSTRKTLTSDVRGSLCGASLGVEVTVEIKLLACFVSIRPPGWCLFTTQEAELLTVGRIKAGGENPCTAVCFQDKEGARETQQVSAVA